MTFKTFEGRVILRVVFLLTTLSLPSVLVLLGWSELLVFVIPLIIYQVWELIRFLRQARNELKSFIESVHYRDFSRHFNEKEATTDIAILRKGFNEINATFLSINKEKEMQYHNLQKIMEMVDTGILSYQVESGEIVLMNDPLKKLLHIPFLKNFNALAKRNGELFDSVHTLQPGLSKIISLQSAQLDKAVIRVLLSATIFQQEGISYKLVVFQNINEALDENESQAWQKLLNVMTHEIMNSVAPISSLAHTLTHRLKTLDTHDLQEHDIEDIELGISSIEKRSAGLLRFAETYRNLSRINKLNAETVNLEDVFKNLKQLMQPTLAQKEIELFMQLKEDGLTIQADPNLLDQVLINLIVNAIEAVKDQPEAKITLSAYSTDSRRVAITVADNGKGMAKEVQEKIFIPFFSTKPQGSGIGLSLCKQIMLLHRGSIQVQSVEGEGTVFTLRFG
jgi:two-component system, NtrC family, nitrogen regulation sensor histidine kinase NtrY